MVSQDQDISEEENELAGEEELSSEEEYAYEEQAILSATRYQEQSKNKGEEEQEVPLWLITFTDVMALMLTFFVLLYSMSVMQEETWEEVSQSLNNKIGRVAPPKFQGSAQETISIGRIDKKRALDLGYLRALLQKTIDSRGIDGVILVQNGDQLIMSLPSELLFKVGSAEINEDAKDAIFVIGGVLERIKNRIEIVGNTDPEPLRNEGDVIYRNNWELSLARSASVASILREVGYDKPMILKGFSSARYDELSSDLPRDQRYGLARRVDIVLMNDDGYRQNAYDVP